MSNKNFKVKHGLTVSGSLIHTNDNKVGIGKSDSTPRYLLDLETTGSELYQIRLRQTGSDISSVGAAGIYMSANNDFGQDGFIRMDDDGFNIGSTNNEDLIFLTNNTEEIMRLEARYGKDVFIHGKTNPSLFVSSSGKVGIGLESNSTEVSASFLQVGSKVNSEGKDYQLTVGRGGASSGKAYNIGMADQNGTVRGKLIVSSSIPEFFIGASGHEDIGLGDSRSNPTMYLENRGHNVSIGSVNNISNGTGSRLTVSQSRTSSIGLLVEGGYAGTDIASFRRAYDGESYVVDNGSSNRPYVAISGNDDDPQIKFKQDTKSYEGFNIGFSTEHQALLISSGSNLHNSSSKAFSLNARGNIGMGTRDAEYDLQISGSNPVAQIKASRDNATLLISAASDNISSGLAGIHFTDRNAVAFSLLKDAGTGTTATNTFSINHDINGTTPFKIDSNDDIYLVPTAGKIAIGEMNGAPVQPLTVKGSISASNGNLYLDSGKSVIWTTSTGTLNTIGPDTLNMFYVAQGEHYFRQGSQPLLYIGEDDNKPNVGIGTETPNINYALAVEGNISSSTGDKPIDNFFDMNGAAGTAIDIGVRMHKAGQPKGYIGYNAGSDTLSIGFGDKDVTHLQIHEGGEISSSHDILVGGDLLTVGNVGIGEGAPSSKLHVLNSDKTLTLEKAASGYFNSFGFDGNDAYMTYYTPDSTGMTLGYGASTGGAPTVDTLFLGSDGNVGINSTNPGVYMLDVRATGSNSLIRAYGSSIARLSLENSSKHYSTSVQSDAWIFFDESAGVERMRMLSDGKFGIGTTAPKSKLTVEGDISASGNLYLDTDVIPAGDIQLENTKALKIKNALGESTQVVKVDSGDDVYIGHPNFDNIYLQGSGGTVMTLDGATGNVGIGTTSPSKLLEVAGDISASGKFYGDGNLSTFVGDVSASGVVSASTGHFTVLDIPAVELSLTNLTASGDVRANNLISDKKIGVGTNTPDDYLHITQSTANTMIHLGNHDHQKRAGIILNTAREGATPLMGVSTLFKTGSHTQFDLDEGISFRSNDKTTMMVNHHSFNIYSSSAADATTTSFIHADIADKRLGINTETPVSTLDVRGEISQSGNFIEQTSDHTNLSGIKLVNTTGRKYWLVTGGSGHSTLASKFSIYDNLAGANRLVIDDSGKVGIGTDSPSKELTVAGDISSSGAIATEGWITGSGIKVDSGSFAGNVSVGGNIDVTGIVTAAEIHSTYESASILYSSGSSKFGDSFDDIHSYTGSLNILGTTGSAGGVYGTPKRNLILGGGGLSISTTQTHTSGGLVVQQKGLGLQGAKLTATALTSSAMMVRISDTNFMAFDSNEINHYGDSMWFQSVGSGPGKGNITFKNGATSADVSTRMFLSSSGKVGIGTTSPEYKLEVSSGGTDEIARFASTDQNGMISVGDNNDMTYWGYDHANTVMSLGFDNSMGSNNLSIHTPVDNAPRIGIGTKTPSYALHIEGNGWEAGGLMIESTSSKGGSLFLQNNQRKFGVYSRDDGFNIRDITGTGGVTDISRLKINNVGDIGLGISSPIYNLDVSASARVNDDLLVTNTGSFGALNLADNKSLNIGNSRDLKIYHSGNNSFITEQGTGNLNIQASNFNLQDKDGNDYITMEEGGAVVLKYDNSSILTTNAAGVTLQGSMISTGYVSTANITASNNISASGFIYSAGNISSDGTIQAPTITGTTINGTIETAIQPTIDHDQLANFVLNEHINHSSVQVIAGDGLRGGGDITSTRTLSVNSASMGGFYSSSMNDFTTTGFISAGGSITASGNISASGEIFANGLNIGGSTGTQGDISASGAIYMSQSVGDGNENSVVVLDTPTGKLETQEIDPRVWTNSLLDSSTLSTDNEIPYAGDANTLVGTSSLSYKNSVQGGLYVANNITASGDGTYGNGDISASGNIWANLPQNTNSTKNVVVYNANDPNGTRLEWAAPDVRIFGDTLTTAALTSSMKDTIFDEDVFIENDGRGVWFETSGSVSPSNPAYIKRDGNDIEIGSRQDITFKQARDISVDGNNKRGITLFKTGKIRVSSSISTSPNSSLEVAGDISSSGDYFIATNKGIKWPGGNTSILEQSNNLYVDVDEDLILRPDEDIVIQQGGAEYARFDGSGKMLNIAGNISMSGYLKTPSNHIIADGKFTALGEITSSGKALISGSSLWIGDSDGLHSSAVTVQSGIEISKWGRIKAATATGSINQNGEASFGFGKGDSTGIMDPGGHWHVRLRDQNVTNPTWTESHPLISIDGQGTSVPMFTMGSGEQGLDSDNYSNGSFNIDHDRGDIILQSGVAQVGNGVTQSVDWDNSNAVRIAGGSGKGGGVVLGGNVTQSFSIAHAIWGVGKKENSPGSVWTGSMLVNFNASQQFSSGSTYEELYNNKPKLINNRNANKEGGLYVNGPISSSGDLRVQGGYFEQEMTASAGLSLPQGQGIWGYINDTGSFSPLDMCRQQIARHAVGAKLLLLGDGHVPTDLTGGTGIKLSLSGSQAWLGNSTKILLNGYTTEGYAPSNKADVNFVGMVSASDDVQVYGDIVATGSLVAGQDSNFLSHISCSGDISMSGDLHIAGELISSGSADFQYGIQVNTANTTGPAIFAGTTDSELLKINYPAQTTNAVGIGGTGDASTAGHPYLTPKLAVHGDIWVTGSKADKTPEGPGQIFTEGGIYTHGSISASGAISASAHMITPKIFLTNDVGNSSQEQIYYMPSDDCIGVVGQQMAINTTAGLSVGHNTSQNNGNEKLNVNGDIIAVNVSASADVIAYYTSDERLKDNIRIIENPIEKINQLKGVQYEWNDKQQTYPIGSADSGIIAQDVQKVLPELVKERDDGVLGVRHDRLVGLLVESIKEQQSQIDELKDEVKKLKGDK